MLSLNIKNLSNEEQSKREEFRQLDSKIKELKNQVQSEEHIIKDDLEYVNEIKSHLEKAKLDNEALNIH
jgi:hemerythrin-like domain-containing protein